LVISETTERLNKDIRVENLAQCAAVLGVW
jgi:hypothetical protein